MSAGGTLYAGVLVFLAAVASPGLAALVGALTLAGRFLFSLCGVGGHRFYSGEDSDDRRR